MTTRVTYLLGAGASANCLPTVQTLMDELKALELKIIELIRSEYDIGPLSDNFWSIDIGKLNGYRTFLEHLMWLRKNCENHETVDTLAKRFFLTGGENSRDLSKLKLTLSAVFTLLQCSNPLDNDRNQYPDRRYDTLLSRLIKGKPGELYIPENIKFLSWNYDLQLEFAAMTYLGEADIIDMLIKLKSFPIHFNFTDGNLPSIVHLNGIAGMYEYDNNSKTNHLYRGFRKEWTKLFDEISFIFERPYQHSMSVNNLFTFAWEGKRISAQAVLAARKIASATDVMVVIGYSVPYFNNEIDQQIFGSFINSGGIQKKIWFLNPGLDGSVLTEQFDINEKFIKHKADCSEFHIPNGALSN